MGNNLGIRFRGKLNAFFLKFLPDFLIILNDPVMDNSNGLLNIAMGMRIAMAGGAVGGPACMRDPDGRMRYGMRLDHIFQMANLALGFTDGNLAVLGRTNAYAA